MYNPARHNGIKITLHAKRSLHHSVRKVFTLLGYFIVFIGSLLQTLQDTILLITSSKVKHCKNAGCLKSGMIHCPKMLLKKVITMACNIPGE
jgi:hypothetical protein